MAADYEVREATPEDAAEIHALAGELAGAVGDAPPDEGAVRARLEELLGETGARVFVAEVAAEHDASLVELVATRANVAARDFYKSLGFVAADVVSLEFVGDVESPPEDT